MIKILHVLAGADVGGISTVVLNYYSFIDKQKFHFDLAITADKIGLNGKKMQDMGANIYKLPLKSKGLKAYEKQLEKIIKENSFHAIHVHDSETSYVTLRIAKKNGIPCRIAHAHTASPYIGLKSNLRRISGCIFNSIFATDIVGCGKLAGEKIFGKWNMKSKKATILPNAIDTEKFYFNDEDRKKMRKELSVEEKFVIGMVARISYAKNIPYAIELFEKIKDKISNACLIIAGSGEDEEKLKYVINRSKYCNDILFLGRRSDADKLYQAFDLYFMPSLYEGFPVAGVEAMATGLPILLSDTITTELEFGSAVKYLPLNDKDAWVESAFSFLHDNYRKQRTHEVKNNGLDIRNTVATLEQIYLKYESKYKRIKYE